MTREQHLKQYYLCAGFGLAFAIAAIVAQGIERFAKVDIHFGFTFLWLAVFMLIQGHFQHLLSLRTDSSQSQTFRWTSKISLFGMPLYDVYFPVQSNCNSLKEATATGIFAVGLSAKGIFAAGVLARGIVTFGVGSFGVVSVGVCSIGLLFAAGTVAVAPVAFGVLAIGIVADGVGAFGWKVLFSVA
jgi:hypothetical protein